MWHKVSPIAFRIPYIKTWKSAWFSEKKSYKDDLAIDLNVREILKKELKWIPTWDILISKENALLRILIYTTKTALVLGKTWDNLDKITKLIINKIWLKVIIDVKEIKKPDLNAKIVWFDVTNQIEKRMPYKKVIKQAISKSIEKWAKWIKIKISWRLNWTEIARNETFKEWNIPNQTIRADIDYVSTRAETMYGALGLKVWIYKWDIYKK